MSEGWLAHGAPPQMESERPTMSVPEQTTDLARAAQQVREHLHELNHEAERFEDCPVWACVLARAYLDLEARRDDDERHHEEHHEQPTSCNNSGDGYLHGDGIVTVD